MTVGLQEFLDGSSSSMPSNMLSMGGRLGGRKKTAWSSRFTIIADADLPYSMLGTMLKHGGGHATSQVSKDGNNSSTLSLSLSF
jgi:hypothetical protein